MHDLIYYSIKKMFNRVKRREAIDSLIHLVELKSINVSDLSLISFHTKGILNFRCFILIILFIAYNLGYSAIDIFKIDEFIFNQNINIKENILVLQSLLNLNNDLYNLISLNIKKNDELLVLKDNLLGFKKCYLTEKAIYNKVINKSLSVEEIEKKIDIKSEPQQLKIFNYILDKCGVVILAGGPGTGKSTWVARWIKDLLINKKDSYVGLKLAATTAKASQRLYEQVMNFIGDDYNIESSTVHSLLNKDRKWSFFPEHKPYLQLEYLVVDEVSMLDSELLYELVFRIPKGLKLILVGDGDQLPSVEIGGFLQSIYLKVLEKISPINLGNGIKLYLSKNFPVVWNLTETYRFLTNSSIGQLAKIVNDGDYNSVANILENRDESVVVLENDQDFFNNIKSLYYEYFNAIKQFHLNQDLNLLINALNKVRILTYSKYGKYGTKDINRFLLRIKYIYCPEFPILFGIPIIVLQNIPELEILNGDIGIITKYTDGIYYITFIKTNYEKLVIDLNKLEKYNTSIAWAITVHKSQGLEFENVVICIKDEKYNLIRSWLYTAITRSKSCIYLYSDYNSIIKIIKNNSSIINFFKLF